MHKPKQTALHLAMLLASVGMACPAAKAVSPLPEGISPEVTNTAQKVSRSLVVQGQVLEKSEAPLPLPGVSIKIKGTTIGTVCDANGYFKIDAKKGDILVFTYLAFKEYEHVVTRAINNLTVALTSEPEQLDEVIVTGMSEEKRVNSVSSVASLNINSNLATKPITNLSQSLAGGITGITVTQGSGLPGSDAATLKIRGVSSINTNSDPLVLVDGVPMDMNQLDPSTIESVTVLKDAAASAIYGARAANGVIVVKTKRGMPGKINVNYNGYVGVQKATYLPKFVDGATYMEMVNEANMNNGASQATYSRDEIEATRNHTDLVKYPDTNWTKFLFKDGFVQSHSVGVSGGSNLARFALTVNYLKNEGLIKKAYSDRLNIRANTTVNLLSNLSVDMDFNSWRMQQNQPMYRDGSYTSSIIEAIYNTPPNTVARYPMEEGQKITYYGLRPESRNPAAMIDRGGEYHYLSDNININIAPRWEIVPRLIARGRFSYQVSSSTNTRERASYNFFDYNSGAQTDTWDLIATSGMGRSSYYYIGGTVEYTLDKGPHHLFAIGGYNQELTNSGSWYEWSLASYFAKANYTFDKRYLVEATVRRDGSSRFGPGHKWGTFPSIGFGWNLHEESFMKMTRKWLNEFKLRGSYGILGNENIGLYKYQTLINGSNGNETMFGNPNITWEKVKMLNVGADIRLFKDLTITFDVYDKLTSDLVLTPPISYIGGTSSVMLNSGSMRNKGWEIDALYQKDITKDFSVSLHGGLSHNQSKIESLFGGPYDYGNYIQKEGCALSAWYVYPTQGLLQESDFTRDADGNWIPKEGVVIFDGQQPGDIHYVDTNGNGTIDTDDRVVRGNYQPDLNYFANITLNYKGWNFEVLFQGVTGVEAYYSSTYAYGLNLEGEGQVPLTAQTNYWTPANTNARYPRLMPNSTYGNNQHTSDFWRFDASYCRVKYIQLGYTFTQMALKKMGIQSIRVYGNVQNPFTIAKENLVDPESRGQKSSYPLVKTYSIGFSLNF